MRFLLSLKKILFGSIYSLLVICGFYACAGIGNPGGGNYDIDPPRFMASNPNPNAINVDKNKITLLFDEYISIENPNEKVIITPPQLKNPSISAVGKKITVELKDTLIPNTTYTFDFTDAIVDNNEKNALEGFSFAFATGDVVDSLEISGQVLNAEDLEPMPKIIIGIHSDHSDTAFTSKPFLRTSQTNDWGRFAIRNVAPGTYRIFALKDANRNFRFDQVTEAIAFSDSLIIPSFEPAIRMDTIWKDTITIETITPVDYTRFTPDNIILKLFEEHYDNPYLLKTERTAPHQFTMEFNSDTGMPPTINLLNDNDSEKNDWYVLEQSPDQKLMTYWITDSLIARQDTLWVEATYLTRDTLRVLVEKNDTIGLFQRRKQNTEDRKDDRIDFLNIEFTKSGVIDIADTFKIKFSEPLSSFDSSMILIEQKIDTFLQKVDLPVLRDSLNPLIYYIDFVWPFRQEYRISIDSAAIHSVYGKWNDAKETFIKTLGEEEYGSLYIPLSGIEGNGFGQLLNASGVPIKKSNIVDGELAFENLKPGKYYLRYIDDRNENGKWDTGNYSENKQPEDVYYYPGFFEVKKYVEWEQSWNVTAIPQEKQKPIEITKNKPAEKKPKRDRDNENKTNTNSTTSSMPRMPF
ncbi:MAG: Ig-like domain-containing protein [Dysgonamonadaceae bacterium]|jgi:uncharacterized protein (DUF2141 family)|nr:Ig-like domain-containing protein [Dysgonamonadaceae bacterium]